MLYLVVFISLKHLLLCVFCCSNKENWIPPSKTSLLYFQLHICLYQMYMHIMDKIQEINWNIKISQEQLQKLQQVGTISPSQRSTYNQIEHKQDIMHYEFVEHFFTHIQQKKLIKNISIRIRFLNELSKLHYSSSLKRRFLIPPQRDRRSHYNLSCVLFITNLGKGTCLQ